MAENIFKVRGAKVKVIARSNAVLRRKLHFNGVM